MKKETKKEMNRLFLKRRRGLSPEIATILIVLLVIIFIFIIFLWARTWTGEQLTKQGNPVDSMCGQVVYKYEILTDGDFPVLAVTNTGNIPLYGFEVRADFDGNEKLKSYQMPLNEGDSGRKEINFGSDFSETGTPDKLIIYPIIAGNVKGSKINRPYPCLNTGEEINL